MSFKNYLEEAAGEINRQLDLFFKEWRKETKKVSPLILPLIEVSISAAKGGKRLRGALVKLGYELAGGKKTTEILKASAAFEIFQTSILAHDDIIDQSPIRRGKPTIYRALGGNHYGISQAICLADIGFFQALKILSEINFSLDLKTLAMGSFSKTMLETALGEVLDIEIPHLGKEKKEEDALVIFKFKTAHYTIVGPLELGAILAGANQGLLDKIRRFGESLGIAFQIQDDILGVFGSERELGKSTTSDVEEGKNTLLITQALEKAGKEQKKTLDGYYGKGKISQTDLEKIKKVFVETGSLEYSHKKALQYVSQAKKVIPKLTSDPKTRKLLGEMASFLVERKR